MNYNNGAVLSEGLIRFSVSKPLKEGSGRASYTSEKKGIN